MEQTGWRLSCKRVGDVSMALGLLGVLAPVWGGVALAVAATMGWPLVFEQTRLGRNGRPFAVYKFRSMTRARDAAGQLLPDSARLTRLGRLLRRTSLDELPQLFNVVRGEMSLVGPRPLLPQYLTRYSLQQARRHAVLPGITGWAQVNGRNSLSWEKRLALDTWYVDNWSLGLDLRILAKTIGTVLSGRGTRHGEHATMPEFMGDAA